MSSSKSGNAKSEQKNNKHAKMSISVMKQTQRLRLGRRDSLVSAPQPQSGLAHSNCLSNWWCLKGVFSLFLDRAACHHAKANYIDRQAGTQQRRRK